ncbi:MAG: right-handed parallel beta-helix repeat-containing protein [Candidatus Eisenbacteria sp.]|nr:right-handed parallel beta-helix repeat-containing protein [Candidatus Eisenbacteria bacterium]
MRPLATILSLSVCVLMAATVATADTYLVKPGGGGDFPTIQAAINMANTGDIIELANGTFTGDGNRDIDFLGKAITVRSQSGDSSACIIDCKSSTKGPEHRGFIFQAGEGWDSVLQGVSIVNGAATTPPNDRGGAIWCKGGGPRISHCRIAGCIADQAGGGIEIGQASPRIDFCLIVDNQVIMGNGGGIHAWDSGAWIYDSVITGNSAGSGGGGILAATGTDSLQIGRCTISNNHAVGLAAKGAGFGGGIVCYSDDTLISDSFVIGNRAVWNGGGIFCVSAPWVEYVVITGNYAESGSGGGISALGAIALWGCTISGNAADANGGGLYCGTPSDLEAMQTIVWDNCANGLGNEIYMGAAASSITFNCCDVDSPEVDGAGAYVWAQDNIFVDPLFCRPEPCTNVPTVAGDYHLQPGSPCDIPPGCGTIGALNVGCESRIWVVCPDGTGDFKTIQDAVDAAIDGDTIELCDGIYKGEGNREVLVTKAVTIRSQSGDPDLCIVDCEWSTNGFLFYTGAKGNGEAALENITIRHGSQELAGGIDCFGTSPTISGCKITMCESAFGGGIVMEAGSAVLSDCEITKCWAWYIGGGILMAGEFGEKTAALTPVVDGCRVHENFTGMVPLAGGRHDRLEELPEGRMPERARQWINSMDRKGMEILPGGAGVGAFGIMEPVLTGCTIENNLAAPFYDYYMEEGYPYPLTCGAGVLLQMGTDGKIQDCDIRNNSIEMEYLPGGKGPFFMGWGGGICLAKASPMIEGCVIDSNLVDLQVDIPTNGPEGNFNMEPFPGMREKGMMPYPGGGGICCFVDCSPVISECVVSDNEVIPYTLGVDYWPVCGAGISCQYGGCPKILDCEIHNNVIPGDMYGDYEMLAGGGVFLFGMESKLKGCTITENSAGLTTYDESGMQVLIDQYNDLDVARSLDDLLDGRGFPPYIGGGLCCVYSMTWVEDCTVADNAAFLGGGFYLEGSEAPPGLEKGPNSYAVILGSLVTKNAGFLAGGIQTMNTWMDIPYSTISGNAAMDVGGILEAPVWFGRGGSPWQEFVSGNSPAGVHAMDGMKADRAPGIWTGLYNTILWGNCAEEGYNNEEAYFASPAEFYCCDVNKQGVASDEPVFYDEDTIFTDPMFCCPPDCDLIWDMEWPFWDVADFHIDYFSPCTKMNSPCSDQIGALGVGCRGNHCEPFGGPMGEIFASVLEERLAGGTVFRLLPPAPNPFNPSTEIHFSIPSGSDPSPVTLTVYNSLGQRVRTLVNGDLTTGIHQVIWNGADDRGVSVASGIYFSRLTWNGKSETKRMILLK